MRVCTPITIRYAETDMMGIVYHANYLLYFEDARTRFLELSGFRTTISSRRATCRPSRISNATTARLCVTATRPSCARA